MKTASRNELARFLDRILELGLWPDDPSNNGLQFAGDAEVAKAVFAVDASAELFCRAADLDAGFIFVHHGISWGPASAASTASWRTASSCSRQTAFPSTPLISRSTPTRGSGTMRVFRT